MKGYSSSNVPIIIECYYILFLAVSRNTSDKNVFSISPRISQIQFCVNHLRLQILMQKYDLKKCGCRRVFRRK